MYQGKYVFAQVVEFLPQRFFDKLVKKYQGNKHIRHFSCWNQFLCMLFGQLTNRDSLRDLVLAIQAHQSKSYHMGFGKKVTRSNLAKVNERRSSKIFEDFAYHLIEIAQRKSTKKGFQIEGNIYAFDSSTIDLCLSVFCWAKFRTTKAGIKLHTLYDLMTQIPVFVHITPASTHDVNAMDVLPLEPGAYYLFDRAYVDFSRLMTISQVSAYFVVRAKSNLKFQRMYSQSFDKQGGIRCDQIGKLTGVSAQKDYPAKIRRIKFYDKDQKRMFIFLTNNFELSAQQITELYKKRWQVELFFKWIKQHLKIKAFWGTSENAVRIQIYTAIIAYCSVAIIAKDLKIDRSNYEILQILGNSLLDKTPVNELFTKNEYKNPTTLNFNQLTISDF